MTKDIKMIAYEVGRALVTTRVAARMELRRDEKEDLIQDFAVYALDRLRYYDSSRGSVANYVYLIFGQWNHDRFSAYSHGRRDWSRLPQGHREVPVSGTPLEVIVEEYGHEPEPSHHLSDRALGLLEMVPEQGRALVATHIAYGASLTATAEIHGVTDRTVSRWVKRAKEVWREEAA